ncbi:DUF3524 domain-containing protein [Desulfobotulus sp.]|jgi:glycosyltransferase involved in cell wall biosynthesis|uniref:tRNA-queuosine alpha-mannosyltransferase domain-containing protein n=1 Tax=Desulfobotulus sp. TaxID=1940337 RepID=UPI002A3709F8|nr:DUF3524 domain-containing protein [Desulfobotulus sp.]MDY0161732.1 DUF3524 domain-containing protein [Desulfobotulus sp.]
MRFLMLEAYYGGSHKAFLDGLVSCLPYSMDVRTLPARHWKWHMRAAALHFLKELPDLASYDGIFTTNMLGVAEFKGLAGPTCPPIFLYFHENQFDYPPSPLSTPDLHPAITDLTSALAADALAFNSQSHKDRFFESAQRVLSRFPKPRLTWTLEGIRQKSLVLYPGCDLAIFSPMQRTPPQEPPCIVWNHRWEHDKNPKVFFDALRRLQERKIPFRLLLLGARNLRIPDIFVQGMSDLKTCLVGWDYPATREAYARRLMQADIAVSTAIQENFGMAIVEAMAAGCVPLLPRRLSYPEILPVDFHDDLLYVNDEALEGRLAWLLTSLPEQRRSFQGLACWVKRFDWKHQSAFFAYALRQMVLQKKN